MAEQLSDLLIENIDEIYPLRSQAIALQGRTVTLDIGKDHGATVGMEFRDAKSEILVEVITVGSDQSTAKIVKSQGGVDLNLPIKLVLTVADEAWGNCEP